VAEERRELLAELRVPLAQRDVVCRRRLAQPALQRRLRLGHLQLRLRLLVKPLQFLTQASELVELRVQVLVLVGERGAQHHSGAW